MASTINTGTTAPTAVLIAGDDVGVALQTIFIWEQIADGTPDPTNSVLLGSAVTSPTNGTFGKLDENGDDFTALVIVAGATSYTLGATGASGDIFLSIALVTWFHSVPVTIRSIPILYSPKSPRA